MAKVSLAFVDLYGWLLGLLIANVYVYSVSFPCFSRVSIEIHCGEIKSGTAGVSTSLKCIIAQVSEKQ